MTDSQFNNTPKNIGRQILIAWFLLLIGSLLVLFAFDRYSPKWVEYLEAKNPRIFIDKANKLLADNKYDEALVEVNNAISAVPSEPAYYILQGDIFERQNKFQQAVDSFEKARKLNSDDFTPWYRIGVSKRKMNLLQESVNSLLEAAKRNKTERWLYNVLGWAAFENNQLEIAYDAWKQASSIVPNETSYYYDLALIHNKRQEWQASLDMYQKVLALDSSQSLAYDLSGEDYFQLKNYELAEKCWTNALHLNPKSASSLRGLARIRIQSKKWTDAEHLLQQALALQNNNLDVLKDLESVYKAMGNKEKLNQVQSLVKKLTGA